MPILCSSLPGLNPGKVRSTMNAVNFSPLIFGEHDVYVRESAVGDPHFLAIQNVVRAFRIQFRASQGVLRVRSGLRLGKTISADPFAGCQLGQILFLLLFVSEINDGKRSDTRSARRA